MKKKILSVILATSLLLCGGCQKKEKDNRSDEEKFLELTNQWFVEDVSSDYLTLHYTVANPENFGIDLNDVEVSYGKVEVDQDDPIYKNRLSELSKINWRNLSADQQVTYKTIYDYYQLQQAKMDLEEDYEFIFSSSGLNFNLITNLTEFVIRNHQDAVDFITLVNDSQRYINDCLDYTRKQAEEGITQIDSSIDEVIDSCKSFISKTDDNEVIRAYNEQLSKFNFSDEEQLKKQLAEAVKTNLIPAYQSIIDFFETMKGKNKGTGAISEYKYGKQYCEVLFREKASTTTSIKTMENKLANAIEEAIDDYLQAIYVEMSDEEYDYYYTDEYTNSYGFTKAVDIFDYLKKAITNDFPSIDDVNYTISYLDPSIAAGSVLAYYVPTPVDDLKNNVVKVADSGAAGDDYYGYNDLCVTLSHEGYPGHMLQHNYYYSNHPNQQIRYNYGYTAYAEGWAMFAENKAMEYFETNKSYLDAERAWLHFGYYLQSYVDILVNYEGYTVEEVAGYLSKFYNDDYSMSLAKSMSEAVIGEPGELLPYAFGMLQMDELYNKTKKELGSSFDFKEYCQVILDTGDTSFNILSDIVDEYIKQKKN